MILSEIHTYYQESFQFLQSRKQRQVRQLVLLNNLAREEKTISSSLLLTLFNRVLSSVYDDKMQVKFLPSQGITQNQLNAYNTLAKSDYIEMNKAKIDYDLCWDTLFFGRGFLETIRFDKKRKIMQPHVINPLVVGYDPYFENPQDWRYYWKWITKSKWELEKFIKKGIITGVTSTKEIPSGVDPYLWEYQTKRDIAKKATPPPVESNRDVFQILEFFGYNENGERSVCWVDKNFSKILYEQVLDLQDGEEFIAPGGQVVSSNSRWPIVVKEAFREPHSQVVYGVADLLEDKHRAKSVLLNLAYIAAKDRANPLYWYDPGRVKDVSQFLSRQINQHIPVDGDGALAVGPINTQDPMSAGLIQFISMLTQEANEPVGTGLALQPLPGKKQTATEAAITQQLNDVAQSLQSKVLQFGEMDFWSHWFYRYKRYHKDLGTKMANIVGVKGVDSQEIDLADFNTRFPPGVMVYSAKEAEYKEMVLRRDLMQLYPALAQTLDPDGMRNFNKFVFFPKFLPDPSLIDTMLPKTLDEMKAEDENESLQKDKLLHPDQNDNHTTHLYTHKQCQPKTWALWFHIKEHEDMLAKQKAEEAQMNQMMQQKDMQSMTGTQKVGPGEVNRAEAATPLKAETMKNKIQ